MPKGKCMIVLFEFIFFKLHRDIIAGGYMWERVADLYNQKTGKFQPFRDVDSLKNKFKGLKNTKKPTGDPTCPEYVKRAKRLQQEIELSANVFQLGSQIDSESPGSAVDRNGSPKSGAGSVVGSPKSGAGSVVGSPKSGAGSVVGSPKSGAGSVVGSPKSGAGSVVIVEGSKSGASHASVSSNSSPIHQRVALSRVVIEETAPSAFNAFDHMISDAQPTSMVNAVAPAALSSKQQNAKGAKFSKEKPAAKPSYVPARLGVDAEFLRRLDSHSADSKKHKPTRGMLPENPTHTKKQKLTTQLKEIDEEHSRRLVDQQSNFYLAQEAQNQHQKALELRHAEEMKRLDIQQQLATRKFEADQENAERRLTAQQERFQTMMTAFTMGIAALSRAFLPTTQPQQAPSTNPNPL